MPKSAKALTARAVDTLSKAGLHADGNGLYLVVKDSGAKSWIFRFMLAGKRRDMGLGSFPAVTLAKARELAAGHRAVLATGRDPIEVKRETEERARREEEAKRRVPTFGEMAERLIASKGAAWRNAKHKAQWDMTLRVHAAVLRDLPVDRIDVADVLGVLRPIWHKIPETASRLRGRIEAVLDAAKAEKFRTGENPAAWRGNLAAILPARQKLTRGHQRALPFDEVPALVGRLRSISGITTRALEFTLLTACRSGEVRGALWSEVDFAKRVWTIPAHRMKAGREHRVPLSDRAIAILEDMRPLRRDEADSLIFPGARSGRPLSDMALSMQLRRMKIDSTVHGFRSAFRDWAGEVSHFPRDVAEAALAHVLSDKTEAAYRRGDALEKRRVMMQAWAEWCVPKTL